MNLSERDVKDILKKGESSFLEFKEYPLRPDSLAKELVAFSNFKGGTLLLGVSDKGEILGVDGTKVEEWVMNVVSSRIEPLLIPSYQELIIGSRRIVAIQVDMGTSKPYAALNKDNRLYYVRVGTTSRLADRDQLRRLFQYSSLFHGEILPVGRSSYKDLELLTVKVYFQKDRKFDVPSLDNEREWANLLINNEYMTKTELGNTVLTIAGTVLFAEQPRKYLPQAGISAAAYKGREKGYDTFERVDIDSPASPKGMVKEVMLFFQRYLSKEKLSHTMQRKRIWEVPEDVLRETVLNAIVHRDYTIASNIEVSIYKDKVEVISPGSLPNTVTVERMKAGCRVPRNPILIQTLKDYGLIEHMGMGVRNKIIKGMKARGKREPLFIVDEYQVKVVLFF